MATGATAPVAVCDRAHLNNDIARLILQGYGADGIAGKLGIDYETARRHCAAVKSEWADEQADPRLLRSQLSSMALVVYRDCLGWAREGQERHRSPLMRVAVSALQAMVDISGLRMMTVEHKSGELAGLMKRLVDLPRAGESPGLDVVDGQVVQVLSAPRGAEVGGDGGEGADSP